MIQCPNYNCRASNEDTNRFCHQCQTPLPRRLLWGVGHHADAIQPGEMVAQRYRCVQSRIFIDTKPGLPPGTLPELPKAILPYLRLATYQLYLPQIYGWVDADLASGEISRLMLLENSAILSVLQPPPTAYPLADGVSSAPEHAAQTGPCLLPSLHQAWPHSPAAQQLGWLWQMAFLWQPLSNESVSSTLLTESLVRVEGPLIRLVELRRSRSSTAGADATALSPGLQHLGKMWKTLVPDADVTVQPFLQTLCDRLLGRQLTDPKLLLRVLDTAIEAVERSHTLQLTVSTRTDKGPSRANNEDACYPEQPHRLILGQTQDAPQPGLVVVCDGIGGHQGGDVASALAIEHMTPLAQKPQRSHDNPETVQEWMRQAIIQANDGISQSNDAQHRRDRQRMGTTLVASLVHGHTCYIANVGDSRAYWITQWGCHQITLDDDVASREARLGYGLYRTSLYQPSAGALIQALGMGSSQSLYPSIQRLILNGNGILLLCSDGLSDQDLVESCWESVFLPVLRGETTDLKAVSQHLITIANTYNGHDNVTVGLLHWQVMAASPLHLPDDIPSTTVLKQKYLATGDAASPSRAGSPIPTGPPRTKQTRPMSLTPPPGEASPPGDRSTGARSEGERLQKNVSRSRVTPSELQSPPMGLDQLASREMGRAANAQGAASRDGSGDTTIASLAPAPDAAVLDTTRHQGNRKQGWSVGLLVALLGVGGVLIYTLFPTVGYQLRAWLGQDSESSSPVSDGDRNWQWTDTLGSTSDQDGGSGAVDSSDHAVSPPVLTSRSIVQLKSLGEGQADWSRPSGAGDGEGDRISGSGNAPPSLLVLFALATDPGLSTAPLARADTEAAAGTEDRVASDGATPPLQPLGTVAWGSILMIEEAMQISAPLEASAGADLDERQRQSGSSSEPRPEPSIVASLDDGRWFKVKVCQLPPTGPSSSTDLADGLAPLPLGAEGWVRAKQLQAVSNPVPALPYDDSSSESPCSSLSGEPAG